MWTRNHVCMGSANLASAWPSVASKKNPAERRSPMDRSRPRSQGASSPRRRGSPRRERKKEEENKKKKRRRERSKSPDKKRRKRSKSQRETETLMATASKAPPLQPPRRPLDIATIVGLWRPPLMTAVKATIRSHRVEQFTTLWSL